MYEGFTTLEEYKVTRIPKKSGGFRYIYEPKDDIKKQQKKHLLEVVYKHLPVSFFAQGFVRNRNIVTNAIPHVNKDYILKLDIKDFFPSTRWIMFVNTFYDIKQWKKDLENIDINTFKIHFLYNRNTALEAFLPQGAPASPALANFCMFPADYTIVYYLLNLQENVDDFSDVDYTRYADDLTISWNGRKSIWKRIKEVVSRIIECYGYTLNHKKCKIIPKHRRQIVCGIVVNEKVSLPKEFRKKVRAIKHKLATGELDLSNKIRGILSFYSMVENYEKYPKFTISEYLRKKEIFELIKGV